MSLFDDYFRITAAEQERTRSVLKESKDKGTPVPKPPKTDQMVGKTRIIVNGDDADILASMPTKVREAVATRPDDEGLFFRIIHPGHVRVWLRQNELHPVLGRWTYIEVQMPSKLLAYPQSKSARAFRRGITMAYVLAAQTLPQEKRLLEKEVEMLLDPATTWLEQPLIVEHGTPKPKKLTKKQLLLDALEALGDSEQLQGGRVMLQLMAPVLAGLKWSADSSDELPAEVYEQQLKALKAELPAFRAYLMAKVASAPTLPTPEFLKKAGLN